MTSLSQDVLPRPLPGVAGRNGLLDQYFYFFMSLLMAVIVVWGFSHSIDHNLLHPPLPPPFVLWIHSAVFTGWIAFYIFQSALVRTHNVRLHRTLGWFGAGLAATMIPLGFVTAVIMSRFNTHVLQHHIFGNTFLSIPFGDMIVFTVLIGLAISWRRKPDLHRRLVLLATCSLLEAAFGRFHYLIQHNIAFAGVDALVLLGITRDVLIDRSVHKVYRIALPLMIVFQTFQVYLWRGAPDWWVAITGWIVG